MINLTASYPLKEEVLVRPVAKINYAYRYFVYFVALLNGEEFSDDGVFTMGDRLEDNEGLTTLKRIIREEQEYPLDVPITIHFIAPL